MTLLHLRLAAIALAILAMLLIARNSDRVVRLLKTFFLESSSPINLALFRVVIFWMLFGMAGQGGATWYADLPSSLRSMPHGWKWLESVFPFDPEIVARVDTLFMLASGCALLGLLTRLTAPIAALSAVYILGIPNFYLKINHSNHAVVLCALIIAFSPCADALSLDRLWKRARGFRAPEASSAYALPLRFCWLIMGTVYLFPGIWKLWDAGDLWLNGVQIQAEMYSKWGQLTDFQPIYRVDRHPWLLSVLGASTLVFEIGFFFALFHRGWRALFALGASAFHLGVLYVMGIGFHPFFPLAILIDFPQLPRLLRAQLPPALGERVDGWTRELEGRRLRLEELLPGRGLRPLALRKSALPAMIGMVLLLGQFVTGLAIIDSWPMAVYPRFSARKPRASTTVSATRVVLEGSDGQDREAGELLTRLGSPRTVRLMRRLGKLSRKPEAFQRQGRVVVSLFRDNGAAISPGDHIVVYADRWDIFPLGERTHFKRKLVDRYRVTRELSLTIEKEGRRK